MVWTYTKALLFVGACQLIVRVVYDVATTEHITWEKPLVTGIIYTVFFLAVGLLVDLVANVWKRTRSPRRPDR